MKALTLIAAGLVLISTTVQVQAQAPAAAAASTSATASTMTEGEVRKVDLDAGKVTLRHGPIANLEMPAMTMVFRVADPKMLEGLQQGEKIRFTAERVNAAMTVTRIEAAR